MEGWRRAGQFETYRLPDRLQVKGYGGRNWKFLLPPGWTKYADGKRLEEVCAFQYRTATETALSDLDALGSQRWIGVSYENLVAYPCQVLKRLCGWADLDYVGGLKRLSEMLVPINSLEPPHPDKWRRNEKEVMSVIDSVKECASKLGYSV